MQHMSTVIRVIATPCHTRRQKWKKATFVPKKAWILANLDFDKLAQASRRISMTSRANWQGDLL